MTRMFKAPKGATRMKVGWGLKVLRTFKDKGCAVHQEWASAGGLFLTQQAAQQYADERFPGVKRHIEGVRINIEPQVTERDKSDQNHRATR